MLIEFGAYYVNNLTGVVVKLVGAVGGAVTLTTGGHDFRDLVWHLADFERDFVYLYPRLWPPTRDGVCVPDPFIGDTFHAVHRWQVDWTAVANYPNA